MPASVNHPGELCHEGVGEREDHPTYPFRSTETASGFSHLIPDSNNHPLGNAVVRLTEAPWPGGSPVDQAVVDACDPVRYAVGQRVDRFPSCEMCSRNVLDLAPHVFTAARRSRGRAFVV